MNSNDFYLTVKGVMRSFLLTLALLFIYAIVVSYKDISVNASRAVLSTIIIVSIMFGTIYSTKKIKKRGWMVGILVAFFYMILLYLVSIVLGQSAIITINSIYKLLIALIIGLLSGVIGINI